MIEKIFIVSVKLPEDERHTDKDELQNLVYCALSGRLSGPGIVKVECLDTFQGDLSKPSEVLK